MELVVERRDPSLAALALLAAVRTRAEARSLQLAACVAAAAGFAVE